MTSNSLPLLANEEGLQQGMFHKGAATGLNIIGDISGNSGLSEITRTTIDAIRLQNIPFGFSELSYGDSRVPEAAALYEDLPIGGDYPINLMFFNLHAFYFALSKEKLRELTQNRYTIASWYWEIARVPENWLPQFRRVDEIWAPTQYTQDIFLHSGNVPVPLIPPPVRMTTLPQPNREFFGIPQNRYTFLYTFSIASGHDRKNPWGAIQAFKKAFGRSGEGGPLLVLKTHGIHLYPEAGKRLAEAVQEIGGILIDADYTRLQMNELLASADAYVSLHRAEGFGLGMAESMYLGKPVIGTHYSGNVDFMDATNSYPVSYYLRPITNEDHEDQEGHKAVFQPGIEWAEPDIDQAASYMQHLYENPEDGITRGINAAATIRDLYSLETVGRRIEQRIHQIAEKFDLDMVPFSEARLQRIWNFDSTPVKRTRLAYWSPLPPQESGISEYSVEVLSYLEKWYDIEIFIDDYDPLPGLKERYIIYPYTEYQQRNQLDKFDINLYHLGTSVFHNYQLAQLSQAPGIIVLHDLAMGHLFYHNAFVSNTIEDFLDEIAYSEGNAAAQQFTAWVRDPNLDNRYLRYMHFLSENLMLRRFVENSLAQIVHLDVATEILENRYQGNPYVVYQGVNDPQGLYTPEEIDALRETLGISKNTFVAGVLGIVGPAKQIDVAIRAFARLVAVIPDAKLLIVGKQADPAYEQQLLGMIQEHRMGNNILMLGRVPSFSEFLKYIFVLDVSITLRYPSFLQMSAIMVRSFAAHKPLICSDLPEWRFLPDNFCYRVDPRDTAGIELANYLITLAQDRELCRQRGENAYRYYKQTCTEFHTAEKTANVINEVLHINQSTKTLMVGINVIGDFYAKTDLNDIYRGMLDVLMACGVSVNLVNRVNTAAPQRYRVHELPYAVQSTGTPYDINLLAINPPELSPMIDAEVAALTQGRYTIGYWFWELDQLPPHLNSQLTRVDEIWVPNQYIKRAFSRLTNKPIIVMPIPFQAKPSSKCDRHELELGLSESAYVFVYSFAASAGIGKKNPFAVIEAFRRAFGKANPEGPMLVVRVSDLHLCPELKDDLAKAMSDLGGILVEDKLPEEDWFKLLASSDAYISLHHSEGIGLEIVEAMYLGKPVIATHYSANVDFMNERNACLVNFQLCDVTLEDHWYDPHMSTLFQPGFVQWANPDIEQAAEYMRQLYDHPEIGHRIGEQAARDIKAYCDPSVISHKIIKRLSQIDRKSKSKVYIETPMPTNIVMPADQSLQETNALLNHWDALRVRQDVTSQKHFLTRLPLVGLVYRMAARVRKLGLIWAAQSAFYHAVMHSLVSLRAASGQTQVDVQIQETLAHLQNLNDRISAAERRLHWTEGRLHWVEGRLQNTEGWLRGAEGRLQSAEGWLRSAEGRLQHTESGLQNADSRLQYMEGWRQGTEGRLSETEGRLQNAEAWLKGTDERFSQDEEYIRKLQTQQAVQEELIQRFGELHQLEHFEVEPMFAEPIESLQEFERFLQESIASGKYEDQQDDVFYMGHQMIFRGSEALIAGRLKHYLDYLKIPERHARLPILDLGCGRGEFLKIMQEAGYKTIGIDINGMEINHLREQGFEVYHGDGLDYLNTLTDESLAGVASFHVMEHVSNQYLRDVLTVVYQKLVPGGFVLFETPNPLNPVALGNFYLDPTHINPIPPQLMGYLMKFYRFVDLTLFLQHPVVQRGEIFDGKLGHYLDYGLLAYKPY